MLSCFFFFNDTATTEIYTLSLHDALPIYGRKLEYTLETELNKEFGLKTINLYSEGRPYAKLIRPGSPAEAAGVQTGGDRKSTRLKSVTSLSRMPSSALKKKKKMRHNS